MKDCRFLTKDEVIFIHADQIEQYGGSFGIRDEGLLASALAQPEAMFGDEFLHPTLASRAAAYLFHLVKNHPFVDGNKRVGTAAALVFLNFNGLELDPSLDEYENQTQHTRLENVVVQIASSQMSKEELTEFIRLHLTPLPNP